jgi:RNA polymerase sigma factor (TIGR02999 family)
MPNEGDITVLLHRLSSGDEAAASELLPHIYNELKKLARSQLRRERTTHSMQTTALVHEAYLRMAGASLTFEDRVHFYRLAAQVMRHILVDHARHSKAVKRGAGSCHLSLDEVMIVSEEKSDLVLAMDEALERFEKLDYRRAQVVLLRFFGGMTEEEISIALNISIRTVKRDWIIARAWLMNELKGDKTQAPTTSKAS